MWKKSDNKKPKEELQEYLKFRNRGSKTPNKKASKEKIKRRNEIHCNIHINSIGSVVLFT